MIELALLQGLGNRENFNKYRSLLNPKTLSIQSLTLLKDYEVYFDTFDHIQIDPNTFIPFFFNTRHPFLDEKTITEYKEIFKLLEQQDKNQDISILFRGFEQQEFYHELKRNLDTNLDIEELSQKIQEFLTKLPNSSVRDDDEMDLKAALIRTDRKNGLQWRCKALREVFQLIVGDLITVGGYTNSGKSSFCASEASYMAQQLKEGEKVYWFTSEGDREDFIPRLYSATLNCTREQLEKNYDKAVKIYTEKMGGDKNRIIINNMYDYNNKSIENLCLQKKPKLVIIDLIDHLQGFDKFYNKENSVEKYKRMYQWARALATKHCPIIVTTQMNAEGEDNMYPPMSALEGSKVAKQSAGCFQLMIGKLISDDSHRYLSLVKDKIGAGEWKAQVKFDALRSRFI